MIQRRAKYGAAAVALSFCIFASSAAFALSADARDVAPAVFPASAECSVNAVTESPDPLAVTEAFPERFKREAALFLNGKEYPYTVILRGGSPFVSFSEFSLFAGARDIPLDAEEGARVALSRGRCIYCPEGIADGLVPLHAAAAACSLSLFSREGEYFAEGEAAPLEPGDEHYPAEDLYWLSRIISSESMTEPLEGKIAVGCVVLNRVRSPLFPDTVKEVVFDRRYGIVQFSPAAGDAIYREPDEESVSAAKICLEGVTLSDEILYFMNPDLATSAWISENREEVMRIGRHVFYS